ncbi:TIR domain-containing protein [uncultured Reyranella sp.]|jgi:hypothetical protein|uniref:TIR domain-containing protein n=1 Tax=uncultured Reyranella sp. TaxID=735512 RepID=UPI00259C754F|nr:TIR domain-containing protein [uncultured Reyranella sp.]
MARKVFYSFHFKRDAWRAGQVRNSNMIANDDEYGVIDSVEWEKIERGGDAAIKRWINEQLEYTSVTVVLIGAETADREYVDYEIRRSWERGNALLGVRIHGVKNQDGETDNRGANPFDNVQLSDGTRLSQICKVYDWVADDGRANLGIWVEEAYEAHETYKGETVLEKAETATPYIRETPAVAPTIAASPGAAVIRNPAKPWAR